MVEVNGRGIHRNDGFPNSLHWYFKLVEVHIEIDFLQPISNGILSLLEIYWNATTLLISFENRRDNIPMIWKIWPNHKLRNLIFLIAPSTPASTRQQLKLTPTRNLDFPYLFLTHLSYFALFFSYKYSTYTIIPLIYHSLHFLPHSSISLHLRTTWIFLTFLMLPVIFHFIL